MLRARERPGGLLKWPGHRGLFTLLALLGLATGPGAPPARAGSAEWLLTGTAAGGHDNNVLGRPGDVFSDGSLAQSYLEFSPDLRAGWSGGRWSATASYTWLFNAYESSQAGVVHDHLAEMVVSWAASPAVSLEGQGLIEKYRRPERDDFDFLRMDGSTGLRCRIDDRWLLRAGAHAGRTSYENRAARPLSSIEQLDEPVQFELAGEFQPGSRWNLQAGAARLVNGSNSTQYDFTGGQLFVLASVDPGRQWNLSAGATREKRNYDEFLRASRIFGQPPRRVHRNDEATWISVDATRRLTPGLSLFGSLDWLDYRSSEPGYSFDQTQLKTGFSLSFGGRLTGPRRGPMAPAVLLSAGREPAPPPSGSAGSNDPSAAPPAGTLFRCRAPEARSVAVAGSFNGWGLDATPMSDPDGDGLWEVVVPLSPGLYRYMFFVDGHEWRCPEGAALYEDDGFGLKNAILEVPEANGTGGGGR